MFYSSEADGLREFLRDKLGSQAIDIGKGWLIFNFSERDMDAHPAGNSEEHGAPPGTPDISFHCDNIKDTVPELKNKDVEFKGDIEDNGYGFVTYFIAPGDFYLQLYQPKYEK
jgi:hypothetical protein